MIIPHDSSTENALLGHLMVDGTRVYEQCRRLKPEMFHLDSHRKIFLTVRDLLEEGVEPDLAGTAAALKKRGWYDSVGGVEALADMNFGAVRGVNISHHVDRLAQLWKARRGLMIAERYSALFQHEPEAETLLSSMQADVFDVLQEREENAEPLVIAYSVDALNEFLAPPTPESAGLPFGMMALDNRTGGMKPGRVTIIGARSGVGKTSLVCQAICENCANGSPFDFFSLEAKRDEVRRRLWSIVSGVPFRRIEHKRCNAEERELVRAAALQVAEWPLRIHDDAELTLGQIASYARMSARRHGMKIFAVDYAQIVNAEGKDDRLRVSNVSRTLTKLAKTENVHLLLLSQLRKPNANDAYNKAPHIGDLRETGQLENDGHLILLLHRKWNDETGGVDTAGEIVIPKQRAGATGTIPAEFNTENLTFEGRA